MPVLVERDWLTHFEDHVPDPLRILQNYQGHINSLDFHRSEDLLVTAGDDDAIRLYNTQNGTEVKQLYSKKHGVCNICYTHAPQAVVYASNKVCISGCACMVIHYDM